MEKQEIRNPGKDQTAEANLPESFEKSKQQDNQITDNQNQKDALRKNIEISNEEENKTSESHSPFKNHYIFIHQTPQWPILSKNLDRIAEGKLSFPEIIKLIEDHMKLLDLDQDCNLYNLEKFFESLNPQQKEEFEKQILPSLAKLAFETPCLFPDNSIGILAQEQNTKMSFSKKQCACLISNMFLCTTLYQNNNKISKRFSFSKLYSKEKCEEPLAINKLRCIFNYFRRVLQDLESPVKIVFERLVLRKETHGKFTVEGWKGCQERLSKIDIRPVGKIEETKGALEIDFADKFIGGTVLAFGAAQEEIQFLTSPELLVGSLFCEYMNDKEAISMRGAQIYSTYEGYLESFTFKSDYQDDRPLSADGVLDREIIAVDALNFRKSSTVSQFSEKGVLRELNKAYVGFFGNISNRNNNKPIATGKWGCGVFRGNTQLKFLIQWLAASRAQRELIFYSFGDESLKGVEDLLKLYEGRKVGDLIQNLLSCCDKMNTSKETNIDLFALLKVSYQPQKTDNIKTQNAEVFEERKLVDKDLKGEKDTQTLSQPTNTNDKVEESQASDLNLATGTYYTFVHMTEYWPWIEENMKLIVEENLPFDEILKMIESQIRSFGPDLNTNLEILKRYFTSLKPEEKSEFEKQILPGLARLVLKTPELFPNKIKILVQEKNEKIILTKEQCACLLANMFMCTTLNQNNPKLPNTFNFSKIFNGGWCPALNLNKLTCLVHYFRRVLTKMGFPKIIIERLVLRKDLHGEYTLEGWKSCEKKLGDIEIKETGKIEDAEGAMEIDFANKFLGGGVLTHGAAQEEIQFITSPELLTGVLFCEVMTAEESISIRGAEIYCNYRGYLDKFTFHSDHLDTRKLLPGGVLDREVIAIDAINFKNYNAIPQFSEEGLLREINKAYVGFFGSTGSGDDKVISTGKWGCGVFQGNTQLKLLIQWLAASRAKRRMVFYSFGFEKSFKGIGDIINCYKGKEIGKLVQDLVHCCQKMNKSNNSDLDIFSLLKTLNA